MVRNLAVERKEQMRKELKVQLPVPIDSKRYLFGKVAFIDVLIVAPFVLLSGLLVYLFYLFGGLGQITIIISLIPAIVVFGMQFTKHKVRKEIPFLKYGVWWKYQFRKREKVFFYRKGAMEMADKKDARRKIGIKSVYANCYLTTDKRFVRVFEVSSVNLSLANTSEKRQLIDILKAFLTTLNFLKDIQFSQIAQPISLTRHIQSVVRKNRDEKNDVKRLLIKSYRNYIDEIQKSRDLVTRKRYMVISQKIGSDREKALEEIDQKSKLLITKVDAMTFVDTSLTIRELNNDDLIKLMYTCVDYDSAVAVGDHIISRANNRSPITVGEETAKQMIETLTKQLEEKIR